MTERKYYSAASQTYGFHHPNQDAVFSSKKYGVVAVFDGLGGEVRGDIASSLAKRNFQGRLNLGLKARQEQVEEALIAAWSDTKSAIADFEDCHGIVRASCMTTASVAKIYLDDNTLKLTYLQAGDSRIYIRKDDVSIQKISNDDSLLIEAAKDGEIPLEEAKAIEDAFDGAICKEDVLWSSKRVNSLDYWDDRHVLVNALNSSNDRYGVQTILLSEDTTHVFCLTDGISDVLTRRALEDAFTHTDDPKKLVRLLDLLTSKANTKKEFGFRSKEDDRSIAIFALNKSKATTTQEPDFSKWADEILDRVHLDPYRSIKVDGAVLGQFEIDLGELKKFVHFGFPYNSGSVDKIIDINDTAISGWNDRSSILVTNPAVTYKRTRKGSIIAKYITLVVSYEYHRLRTIDREMDERIYYPYPDVAYMPVFINLHNNCLREYPVYRILNTLGKPLRSMPHVEPIKRKPRSASYVFENGKEIPNFGKNRVITRD